MLYQIYPLKQILEKLFLCFLITSCCSLQRPSAVIETYDPHRSVSTPKGMKIVLVGGCFDILHASHFVFLQKSKSRGNYLIVALEPDERIIHGKKRSPIYPQIQRAYNLLGLGFVDKVLLLPSLKGFEDYNQLVKAIRPSVIAATDDDPQLSNKRRQAESAGAVLEIVNHRNHYLSSTKIYNKTKNNSSNFKNLVGVYTNVVKKGKQEARVLGYPTANISLPSCLRPKPGVYSCDVWTKEQDYTSMCYYDDERRILEAHLFHYKGNLYGKPITIVLKKLIRSPKKVFSLNELRTLLTLDAEACSSASDGLYILK